MLIEKKKSDIILILCIIVGGAIRVLYCWKYPVPVRDSIIYKDAVENWIESGSFPDITGIPPLGLYLFKVPAWSFGCDIIIGGTVLNGILGLFLIMIAIKIIIEFCNSRLIQLLFGIVISTHPTLVRFSCQMTRENSYLFFGLLSSYYAIRFFRTKNIIHLIIFSFFSATATMCRYEGLEIYLICLIILTFFIKKFKSRILSRYLAISFIIFIISIILISISIGVPLRYYKTYITDFSLNMRYK